MADLMERKIAVVGLGALFPDAKDPDEFWQNITAKKVSIKPLPENMLDSEVFYRPDLLTAFYKEDKTTTKVAAWIDDLSFDTVRKYRIPPSVAEHMDANQHAALYVADQALDADTLAQVAADRIAVIFGNGMVGTRYGDALARVQFQLVEHYARKHAAFQKLSPPDQEELLGHVREVVLATTIPITEDSAPGILPNIIAGRIASVYDFHGPSFTVDAACASVLAAVIRGIQGLRLDEYDAVLCGGADMPLKHLGFVMFSALNALSPDGSFPFDKRANGFVMGQGAGALFHNAARRQIARIKQGFDIRNRKRGIVDRDIVHQADKRIVSAEARAHRELGDGADRIGVVLLHEQLAVDVDPLVVAVLDEHPVGPFARPHTVGNALFHPLPGLVATSAGIEIQGPKSASSFAARSHASALREEI